MQYLENSLLSLRAVHYTLRPAAGGPEIQLFPMVHIGSPTFYAQVRARLDRCDTILYEGVSSLKVRILTLAYRLVVRRKSLGLVCQDEALRFGSLRARLVHGDVSTLEFQTHWNQIPLRHRVLLALGAPLYGAYLSLTATRESLGRRMSLDDAIAREEAIPSEDSTAIDNAIIRSRDAKLLAALESLISTEARGAVIGAIYGAAHMPAVTDLLMEKHKYRVSNSEWLEVFDYGSNG